MSANGSDPVPLKRTRKKTIKTAPVHTTDKLLWPWTVNYDLVSKHNQVIKEWNAETAEKVLMCTLELS